MENWLGGVRGGEGGEGGGDRGGREGAQGGWHACRAAHRCCTQVPRFRRVAAPRGAAAAAAARSRRTRRCCCCWLRCCCRHRCCCCHAHSLSAARRLVASRRSSALNRSTSLASSSNTAPINQSGSVRPLITQCAVLCTHPSINQAGNACGEARLPGRGTARESVRAPEVSNKSCQALALQLSVAAANACPRWLPCAQRVGGWVGWWGCKRAHTSLAPPRPRSHAPDASRAPPPPTPPPHTHTHSVRTCMRLVASNPTTRQRWEPPGAARRGPISTMGLRLPDC